MSITNILDLRQHLVNTLNKLSREEITIQQAAVDGKLCGEIVSTLKTQLEYAKALGQTPQIDFLEGSSSGRELGHDVIPKLEHKDEG